MQQITMQFERTPGTASDHQYLIVGGEWDRRHIATIGYNKGFWVVYPNLVNSPNECNDYYFTSVNAAEHYILGLAYMFVARQLDPHAL